MAIRTIFFGTPAFALPTLRILQEHPAIDLRGVVTRPDRPAGRGKALQPPPVKLLAHDLGLDLIQPETLKDPAIVEWLRQRSPDVVVVVAYGAFIPKAVRAVPPFGCVNLHPSRLPRYRGAAPIQWTLINGETSTANTTMYLSDGWDDGDIIYQEEEPVRPEDTAGSLAERLAEKGAHLVLRSLTDIAAGTAPRIPQNEAEATFAPQIKNEDARIDWSSSAEKIRNQVRAFSPKPGAWAEFRGKEVKIWRARVDSDATDASPGQIVAIGPESIRVATGEGTLWLEEVQEAGKSRMGAGAFARGARLAPGERFS